jgi:hypothetical protein
MACSLFMTSVVDQHRFDTYPDPDSNPNVSFTHVGKLDFLYFYSQHCQCHTVGKVLKIKHLTFFLYQNCNLLIPWPP